MATTITANGINFPDGSASSPSIGGSDTNTGLFTGADIIGFSTGGSERLRIDSDGRLLLGTTTPGNSTADDLTIATSSNTGITLRSATNGEGNIFFGDGTSGADQYRGMVRYFHNDDALAFNAAGSERMRIDSSGNVMIGASSASGKFHVEHSGENNVYFIGNTSTSGARLILQNKNTTANSFTGLLGADAGGQTTSQILFYNADNANNEGFITFETRPSGGLPAERMRIDSSGKLLVGRTNNITITGDQTDHTFEQLISNQYAIGLHCNQQYQRGLGIYYTNGQNASDAIRFAIGSSAKFIVLSSGNVTNANNSYGQISDVSLKENIVDANSQWDDIKNLKIRNFNFKSSTGYDTHTQIGLVAQEVETVCPKLVDTGEDGIKRVTSSVLYMKAVKALQEAVAKIEVLETKVAALEAG